MTLHELYEQLGFYMRSGCKNREIKIFKFSDQSYCKIISTVFCKNDEIHLGVSDDD